MEVAPLGNRTADPEAGALVAAALRRELARRGADGPGATAVLDGEVEEIETVPTAAGSATWRLTLTVRARLAAGGKTLGERRVKRSEGFVGGVDALETEGRRRLALGRAAEAAAREILEGMDSP